MELYDRIAIITGGANGIDRACALAFAKDRTIASLLEVRRRFASGDLL